jgi:class 3 adenylate cyclase
LLAIRYLLQQSNGLAIRTLVVVPMFRDNDPLGSIAIYRREVRPFTEKQIALLTNFAAQAVIAIENTRLLNELRQRTTDLTEALEQQRATSDLLQVISGSPGNLEPVFRALLENAVGICGANFGNMVLYEDNAFRTVAMYNAPEAYANARMGASFHRPSDSGLGRLFATKEVVQIADMRTEQTYINRDPFAVAGVEWAGIRTLLAVPMLKEDRLVGSIGLRRFLPPQVADLIVASGAEKQLESHRREITALFCDLRGFTGFTESADAEDVMALLGDYHAAIGELVIRYSGTLERYAGDGVMVVFNDPVPVENSALQAVLMALELRNALGALTHTWSRLGHEIGFGIGIAHGFATLGTIGFEGRFDYAAIGTVSNVASRLCDEAKPGQILISPRVLMKVEKAVQVEPVGEFELKGIRRPLAAYNVVAIQTSDA